MELLPSTAHKKWHCCESLSVISYGYVLDHRDMTGILPIRRKTRNNQSIDHILDWLVECPTGKIFIYRKACLNINDEWLQIHDL